jgi:hypothetical protein
VAHDAHLGGPVRVLAAPVAEEVVDDRVEALLRWVPRFEEVVVEADLVDRGDGDGGVGVRRQQQQPGLRRAPPDLAQHLDPGQLRHPLVGGDEGDRLVAQLELRQHLERLPAGRGVDDAVFGAVAGAQVAGDGPGHGRVVVDNEDRRLPAHDRPFPRGGSTVPLQSADGRWQAGLTPRAVRESVSVVRP